MSPLRIIVGLLTVAGVVGVAVVHRDQPLIALGLVGVVVTLGVLADIDFRTELLPDRIVGPLALAVVAGVAIAGLAQAELGRSGQALATGAAFLILTLMLHLIGGFGLGDVKLSFPIGVIAGWLGVEAVMATASVTALGGLGATIVLLVVRGRGEFSYGPYMALGSVAGMVLGGQS